MVRVKICGLTTRADAFAAVDAGADALGFMLVASSPRRITPAAARAIVRALPPLVTPVGVFLDEAPAAVAARAAFCEFGLVQLHGAESPAAVARIGRTVPVMKVIRVRDARDIARAGRYRRAALRMFDTFDPAAAGGTGRRFDWGLLRRARPPRPWLLAGGLTPANVAGAVRCTRPYGVDVSSGVESSPGRKDARKVARFIREAKDA